MATKYPLELIHVPIHGTPNIRQCTICHQKEYHVRALIERPTILQCINKVLSHSEHLLLHNLGYFWSPNMDLYSPKGPPLRTTLPFVPTHVPSCFMELVTNTRVRPPLSPGINYIMMLILLKVTNAVYYNTLLWGFGGWIVIIY